MGQVSKVSESGQLVRPMSQASELSWWVRSVSQVSELGHAYTTVKGGRDEVAPGPCWFSLPLRMSLSTL